MKNHQQQIEFAWKIKYANSKPDWLLYTTNQITKPIAKQLYNLYQVTNGIEYTYHQLDTDYDDLPQETDVDLNKITVFELYIDYDQCCFDALYQYLTNYAELPCDVVTRLKIPTYSIIGS